MNPNEPVPVSAGAAGPRHLLLYASLARVVTEESGLQVSSERLEAARRLHPEGLLSNLQLREIVQEYVLAKNRSERALETLHNHWLSVIRKETEGGRPGG